PRSCCSRRLRPARSCSGMVRSTVPGRAGAVVAARQRAAPSSGARNGLVTGAPPDKRGLLLEIQALRAVAVALVVVFHVWPAILPGGYIGVDVFFVISGFLITAHLLREH